MTYVSDDPVKRAGILTSEFVMSVLLLVISSVLLFTGTIDQDTWRWVVGPVAAAYAVSRGLAKT